jgi:hypothetical protein
MGQTVSAGGVERNGLCKIWATHVWDVLVKVPRVDTHTPVGIVPTALVADRRGTSLWRLLVLYLPCLAHCDAFRAYRTAPDSALRQVANNPNTVLAMRDGTRFFPRAAWHMNTVYAFDITHRTRLPGSLMLLIQQIHYV